MTTPLYLIDGSGFIFRAFYALPPMTRSDGTPTNAVYGFCNMLQKVLADEKPELIAVIFDAARKTFRNDIYPEYKAHRPPPPDDLVPQFALIREATRAFGIPAIEAANYEADDLIATYARIAAEKGREVRILSSDKDLMQLVTPMIRLYDPMKLTLIEREQVIEKFGVPPEQVIDVQALAGDSADNVPGVPGIGIKTAAQLIIDYGNLETLLAKAGDIKQPKRRALLIDHAESARISKKLVTLDANAPLPLPLEEMTPRQTDPAQLAAFLQTMEFRSLLARLSIQPSTEKKPAPTHSTETIAPSTPPEIDQPADATIITAPAHYECVQTTDALKKWVALATEKGFVAIDTETTSLTPSTTTLVGASLAIAPGIACYIPLAHKDPAGENAGFFDTGAAPDQITLNDFVALMKPLLADPSVLKIAHNLKFDSQVLGQHNLTIAPYDDTMLLSYVLYAGTHGHGLDELAALYLDHKMIAYSEVTGSGKAKKTFDRVPLDEATPYAAEDADYTFRLWLLFKPLIAKRTVASVYERHERPLVPVIAEMEKNGILIDTAILRQQSQALAGRMAILESEVHTLAGTPFNLNSPKQLGDILFDKLRIDGGKKGKTGAFTTSASVLDDLAEQGHPIAQKLLDWRGLSKLKSTYTDALPDQIDPKTGRIHTSFNMVGTATGRLSSTDPNLQNIPIRSEDGRAIRAAFIAKEGHELLSVDYSQIELRLAAHAANISALIQAFKDGSDIHALTASQVFGIPLKDMTPEIRRRAKAINFGIIYGISGFGLSKQIDCSPSEANTFIRQYLDRFHELRDWMDSIKDFAHKHGYVETLFGRRIHLAGIHEKLAARKNFAERQAINAPLQGTAADIMKRAMIRVLPALKEANLSAKLLLQVHDELVFEVPIPEIEKTTTLVKRIMEEAPAPHLQMRVPLTAEAGHAQNWSAAH